jgi:hypothetical protein
VWKSRQELAANEAWRLAQRLAAAYTPGSWDNSIPQDYMSTPAAHVPEALDTNLDLQMPGSWPIEREHVPIVAPPTLDPAIERERLEEQARILHQRARERDEFGEEFYDLNEEPPEVCAAFEALGTCRIAPD